MNSLKHLGKEEEKKSMIVLMPSDNFPEKACMETGLPRDLLIEILIRLRVKSLCRFRCVSKEWLYLISDDPDFKIPHAQVCKKNPRLFFFRNSEFSDPRSWSSDYFFFPVPATTETQQLTADISSLSLNNITDDETPQREFCPTVEEYLIVVPNSSSCRDLICLVSYRCVYICNPSIQEITRMPEPSNESCEFTFGYLPSSEEFILFHLYEIRRSRFHACEILKFSTNKNCDSQNKNGSDKIMWRLVEDKFPGVAGGPGCQAWGEIFFWIIWDESLDTDDIVVSFDLQTEKFRHMSLPPGLGLSTDEKARYSLQESRDNLYFFDESQNTTMAVWILKDLENEVWERVYSICKSEDKFFFLLQELDDGEPLFYSSDYLTPRIEFFIKDEEGRARRLKEFKFTGEKYKVNLWFYNESFTSLRKRI